MKLPGAFILTLLSCIFVISVSAAPLHLLAKKDSKSLTKVTVVTTFTTATPTAVPTVIKTLITEKGVYTFPHDITINVKNAPTRLRVKTSYKTSVDVTVTSIYTTQIPITPSPTLPATTVPTGNCDGVEGSASDAYFTYQIGDYYESISDAKACSAKCALFADCVAFEFQDIKDADPDYPQNCWLYTKLSDKFLTPGSTSMFFYRQECFAKVNVPTIPTYPKDKVCGVTGANSSQYGRTILGEAFKGSVQECAKMCTANSQCQVYQYSEIEFLDGNNCHIYSGALPAEYQQYKGLPVTLPGTTSLYRWIYERGCAAVY